MIEADDTGATTDETRVASSFREAFQVWIARGFAGNQVARPALEPLAEIAFLNGAMQALTRVALKMEDGEDAVIDELLAAILEANAYFKSIKAAYDAGLTQ